MNLHCKYKTTDVETLMVVLVTLGHALGVQFLGIVSCVLMSDSPCSEHIIIVQVYGMK